MASENRGEAKVLTLGALLALSVRLVGALSVFFMNLVVGRMLGVEESGYFFLAFAIAVFLGTISRCGFSNVILKITSSAAPVQQWGVVSSVFWKSIFFSGCFSVFVFLCVLLFSRILSVDFFSKPDIQSVLINIAPSILFFSIYSLISMSLQGQRKIVGSVFVLNISSSFILAVFCIGFSVESAADAAYFYSLSTFITMLLGFSILLASGCSKFSTVNSLPFSDIWKTAKPLWVVIIMNQVIQWSGQFIAGVYIEPDQVAQLAVAQRTAMLTSFVLVAINLVVAPKFALLYSMNDIAGLRRVAVLSVKLTIVAAMPIVAIMLVFPEFIMGFFGEEFSSGSIYLRILVLGQFVNVITGSVTYLLMMSGYERDVRNILLLSAPFCVFLGVLLTVFYGGTGSAVATAICVAGQNLFAVYFVKKRLGFNTLLIWK
ncbi:MULTISPECIES: oligosaccharide flippase family protein [unclassified Alcanivorax]|uniref:oligosaccharide flippase family protein n=4 Tax=Alcanivorax TaxID=59753 RepID=UPI0018D422F5|nr:MULTISPECIES: oligosaccharide flippase family protein [unclassified Alcanivorax]